MKCESEVLNFLWYKNNLIPPKLFETIILGASFSLLQKHSAKFFNRKKPKAFQVHEALLVRAWLALNFEILDGKINREITTGLWMFKNPLRGHEPNLEWELYSSGLLIVRMILEETAAILLWLVETNHPKSWLFWSTY